MRFRLSSLFLVFVVAATSLAMSNGARGIFWFTWALLLVQCIRKAVAKDDPRTSALSNPGHVMAALLIVIAVTVAMSGVDAKRDDYRLLTKCEYNLKQISLALNNYQDVHNCFPPPYLSDEDGKPKHSWRVLILPHFGDQVLDQLYRKYRFDEPWNGPNNSKLSVLRPSVYCCPRNLNSDMRINPTATNYLAVVSQGATWGKSLHGDDNVGRQNSITVVEVASSQFHWMAPVDIPTEQAASPINGTADASISSGHATKGANVALRRGDVMFLPENVPSEVLLSLVNGELDQDQLREVTTTFPSLASKLSTIEIQQTYYALIAWAGSTLILLVHGLIIDSRQRGMNKHKTGQIEGEKRRCAGPGSPDSRLEEGTNIEK